MTIFLFDWKCVTWCFPLVKFVVIDSSQTYHITLYNMVIYLLCVDSQR